MGLITGLITLPLAPMRGAVWSAERILEQAEHELDGETQLRRQLGELRDARELGEITESEYERAEAELVAQFDTLRESAPREGMGDGVNG